MLDWRSATPVETAPSQSTGETDDDARRLHEQFEKELAAFDA